MKNKSVDKEFEPVGTTEWNLQFTLPKDIDKNTDYKTIKRGYFGRFDWVEEYCDTPEECEFKDFLGNPVFDNEKKKYLKYMGYECSNCGSKNVIWSIQGDNQSFECKDCGNAKTDRIICRD